jgi:hypothetical protein
LEREEDHHVVLNSGRWARWWPGEAGRGS